MAYPIEQFKTAKHGYEFGVPTFYSSFHLGLDLLVPKGTPVYAVGEGTVSLNTLGDTGNMVTLWDGTHSYRYMHLSHFSVPNGAHVSDGQLLGLSGGVPGDTGAGASTAAHLHFDIYIGHPVNPTNRSGFRNPQTFSYPATNQVPLMKHIAAYKTENSVKIRGIVEFESPAEVQAAGYTNQTIQTVDTVSLVKKLGADPVYIHFHLPSTAFASAFDATMPVVEYSSLDLAALNRPNDVITELERQKSVLERKIQAARESLL